MIKRPRIIPHTPGVYLFKKGSTFAYIGKAANLKKRLASYFRKNAGGKVSQLLAEATALEWIETLSEAEALIKEAELIKAHRPKFNYLMRDDKSYFYVGFTRDTYPRVAMLHKTALDGKYRRVIGPFTVGSQLRQVLKLLRRLFPYCTCKELHKRPCLNAQIGRCPGYCCLITTKVYPSIDGYALVDRGAYRKNINGIIAVLSGKRRRLLSQLRRKMRVASKAQEYERAAQLRDQIAGLEDIFSHRALIEVRLQSDKWRRIEGVVRKLAGSKSKITRVEGYDISNISGTSATGSMAVFIDGVPAKSEYRKFKIKTVRQPDDISMHKEVMRRRLTHPEWQYPGLVLIDGGKAQLNAIRSVIAGSRLRIPIHVASLAKREEELYTEESQKPVRLDSLPKPVMHFFQHVRDESHRFAKKYHHKLREISYREQAAKT